MGPAPFRRPCISGAGDDVPVGGFIGHGAVRGPGGASIRARRLEGGFVSGGAEAQLRAHIQRGERRGPRRAGG